MHFKCGSLKVNTHFKIIFELYYDLNRDVEFTKYLDILPKRLTLDSFLCLQWNYYFRNQRRRLLSYSSYVLKDTRQNLQVKHKCLLHVNIKEVWVLKRGKKITLFCSYLREGK